MCTRAMILVFSRRRREKNVGTRDPTIASPPPFSLLTSDKKKEQWTAVYNKNTSNSETFPQMFLFIVMHLWVLHLYTSLPPLDSAPYWHKKKHQSRSS
jgi:hypothetical protein